MPILDIAMVALQALLDIVTGIVDGAMAALKWLGGVLGIDLSAKAGPGSGVNTTTMEGILAASGKSDPKKPPKPPGGGGGKKDPIAEAAKKALEGAIKTLEGKLQEARKLIADTVEKFRNSVDTAFGLVQRGSGMIFRADRYIRELKRMKAATADFNSNLQKLRDMGGKAANPLLEQIMSKSPEEAAAIMRSFAASPDLFAEAINTTNSLAATGKLAGAQANAMAGNQTQAEMLTEMKLLRSDLAAGKNTYNIKATMSASEIINQIRAWEKSTGKKVLTG
jgi:soluble cytochrome b562